MVVLFSLTFRKIFCQVSTLAKQQINKYVEDLVPGLKGRYVYFFILCFYCFFFGFFFKEYRVKKGLDP